MSVMNFTPPPRRVPLSLRVVNFFNVIAQIGWAVFGFGMIFFWVFASNADFSFATFRGAMGRATGRITSVENTNASENRRSITKSYYQYSVAGETYNGKSYTTGSAPEQGSQVEVEYLERDPSRSRIPGMRTAMFGPWAAIVTIFPLIGFLILFFATRSGIKRNRLLRDGMFAQGTLVSKEPTNMTVNNRRVWALTFEFTDRNGMRREATARTSDTQRLEDEPTEALLYDPNDLQCAYVLDEAPSRPKLENGELVGRPVAAVASLIVPGLVIAVHGLIGYIKFIVFK